MCGHCIAIVSLHGIPSLPLHHGIPSLHRHYVLLHCHCIITTASQLHPCLWFITSHLVHEVPPPPTHTHTPPTLSSHSSLFFLLAGPVCAHLCACAARYGMRAAVCMCAARPRNRHQRSAQHRNLTNVLHPQHPPVLPTKQISA